MAGTIRLGRQCKWMEETHFTERKEEGQKAVFLQAGET